ncbi:16S rRNA (adenine(1518)-N(6)/adenine(1519)-N(6))-dimethyltransferase RsmA [Candidatus Providencia siddallii]|uniref:Ribosomal RNA small subunit methyltransferase A n=1 Tax=Candidatus Providencia siddallii TaxID=1715285 RepID=A0ABM9NP84_9GAMM
MKNQIYKGHLIRKCFGQNFLIDNFVIKNIVNIIDPKPDQSIIEIGPGFGSLTKVICNKINNITVIEIDSNLVKYLISNSFLKNKITVIHKNAMMFNFGLFAKQKGQSIRIFGNLPYNISTQLIFYLFKFNNLIFDMHFMLQKEVVNRLIAKPGNKNYGSLSVIIQYYCNVIPILEVLPTSFIPIPKVYSSFVKLVPHKKKQYFVKNINLLKFITKQAFNNRRKTIKNSLKKYFNVNQLINLNINPELRAENISFEEYCKMSNYLDVI